jgi:hypothetical protein
MKPLLNLFVLLLAVSLFIGCGDSPSGPGNTPTPSVISVEFTGEEKGAQGEGVSLQIGGRGGVTRGLGNLGPQSHCQITATWTICPDANFKSYSLYRSTVPGIAGNHENADVLVAYTDANQRTYVDEDLEWGITYYYAVRTGNSENKYSWSNEAEIVTPGDVPTPTILTAIAGLTQVALEWTKCPDPNFSHYSLYRSYSAGIAGDTLFKTKLRTFSDPDMLSFIDSTLTQKTAYYALRTTNSVGSLAWSNEVTVTLPSKYVLAWGWNAYGQCNVPSPNSGFVAVSGGYYHSLGLKEDGSIVAWGQNDYGQCNVPSPNSGFVAIAGGWRHSLGLKEDGSIVAWGANGNGQCNVPSPNSGFVAVEGGGWHSLGLKEDGSIVAWGWNDSGQCNVPSPNSGFVAVAGGGTHSLGLKVDGSIVAWGYNYYGQCDVPSPNSGFVAVAAGMYHNLGLKADGSIVAWGAGGQSGWEWPHYGQCAVPFPNNGFVAAAGGYGHSLGLKADGSIVAWGWNDDGQCNVPSPNSGFVAVEGGSSHSLGLKE